jgi:hypothetical protein
MNGRKSKTQAPPKKPDPSSADGVEGGGGGPPRGASDRVHGQETQLYKGAADDSKVSDMNKHQCTVYYGTLEGRYH